MRSNRNALALRKLKLFRLRFDPFFVRPDQEPAEEDRDIVAHTECMCESTNFETRNPKQFSKTADQRIACPATLSVPNLKIREIVSSFGIRISDFREAATALQPDRSQAVYGARPTFAAVTATDAAECSTG